MQAANEELRGEPGSYRLSILTVGGITGFNEALISSQFEHAEMIGRDRSARTAEVTGQSAFTNDAGYNISSASGLQCR
jgi:hypothetical protein